MGRQRRHAHRDERALRRRQRTDHRQELIRPRTVHNGEQGLALLGQPERPLAAVLGFRSALEETAPHQAVNQPAGGGG